MKKILTLVAMSLLATATLVSADIARPGYNEPHKRQALMELDALEKLEAQQAAIMNKQTTLVNTLAKPWRELQAQLNLVKSLTEHGSQRDLLEATKRMQEMQMSFNLQYLQLQNAMQNEYRSYTAISNIMKTKHDTVKNSISNIR